MSSSSSSKCRAITGRFLVTPSCDIEFVPSSTSVKYKCELTGTFADLTIARLVIQSKYVIVPKWHWLAANVMVIDATSVTATDLKLSDPPPSGKTLSGTVTGVSAFLRIKEANDPFNNSFCVQLGDGTTVVLRTEKFYLYRYLIQIGSFVEFVNFRKIKIKNFNTVVHISSDDSDVSKYDTVDHRYSHTQPIDSAENGKCVVGRVVSIDPGVLWMAVSADAEAATVPVVMSNWGKCDRRRISIGAVVSIRNFHFLSSGIIALCPSTSSVTVCELPPLSLESAAFYSVAPVEEFACIFHLIDRSTPCTVTGDPPTKFCINSLCSCGCVLTCDQAITLMSKPQTQQSRISVKKLFAQALREAELCLSLIALDDVFVHPAPPFFNVSLTFPVSIEPIGAPSAEIAKAMKALPSTLYLSLFPPNKPLNSYTTVRLMGGGGADVSSKLTVLIPRDFALSANARYLIKQMLIVNSTQGASVNAIIQRPDCISKSDEDPGDSTTPTSRPTSPHVNFMNRRNLLRQKLIELMI